MDLGKPGIKQYPSTCTSCGVVWDGEQRVGPQKCIGQCAWRSAASYPDRQENPPQWETGDVVAWSRRGQTDVAVVVTQLVRGGMVVVAINAQAFWADADELEMVQAHG